MELFVITWFLENQILFLLQLILVYLTRCEYPATLWLLRLKFLLNFSHQFFNLNHESKAWLANFHHFGALELRLLKYFQNGLTSIPKIDFLFLRESISYYSFRFRHSTALFRPFSSYDCNEENSLFSLLHTVRHLWIPHSFYYVETN